MDRFHEVRAFSRRSSILEVKHLSSPLFSIVHFLDIFVFPAHTLWNHVSFFYLKDEKTVLNTSGCAGEAPPLASHEPWLFLF